MKLKPRERVDWFRVITTLRGLGLTEEQQAAKLDVPRTTLRRWKSGAEPGHADGTRLIDLYCTQTQLPTESVPVLAVHDFRA